MENARFEWKMQGLNGKSKVWIEMQGWIKIWIENTLFEWKIHC